MVAKLTITAEDETAAGFESAIDNEKKLDGATQDLREEFANLFYELEQIENQLQEVVHNLNRTEDKMDDVGDQAKKTGKEGEEAFSKKIGSAVGMAMAKIELVKKALELTGRAFAAAAEDGSPAFKELADTVEEVQGVLLDLANDPMVQEWVSGLNTAIKDQLIPTLKSLPDMVGNFQDAAADTFAYWGEQLGVFEEGTLATLQEMQVEADKARELNKEAVAERRVQIQLDEKFAELERKLATEEATAAAKAMEDIEAITALIEEQTAALEERIATGDRNKEADQAAWSEIEALERRRYELQQKSVKDAKEAAKLRLEAKQNEDAEAEQEHDKYLLAIFEATEGAEKKAHERRMSLIQKEGERKQRLAKDEVEKTKAQLETEAQLREEAAEHKRRLAVEGVTKAKEAADKEVEIEKQKLEKKKQLLSGGANGNVAAQLLQQQQARGGAAAIAEQRAREAAEKFDKENKLTGNETAGQRRRMEAERQAAMRKAAAGGFKDFKQGNVSQEEVAEAQKNNVNAMLGQLQSQGRLSQTTTRAMQELTSEITAQKQETDALNQEMQRMAEYLGQQRGKRAKAQGGSLK